MSEVPTALYAAAQLAALAPRELDALAHFHVFNRGAVGMRDGEPVVIPTPKFDGPCYSTSLDAAALLEAELARRGLRESYANAIRAQMAGDLIDYCNNDCVTNMVGLFEHITASAKDRTIAAIIAVQDSPYLQIVTWDKHPKDAANSQSASDSPDA